LTLLEGDRYTAGRLLERTLRWNLSRSTSFNNAAKN
jgi:hypothetical protein